VFQDGYMTVVIGCLQCSPVAFCFASLPYELRAATWAGAVFFNLLRDSHPVRPDLRTNAYEAGEIRADDTSFADPIDDFAWDCSFHFE